MHKIQLITFFTWLWFVNFSPLCYGEHAYVYTCTHMYTCSNVYGAHLYVHNYMHVEDQRSFLILPHHFLCYLKIQLHDYILCTVLHIVVTAGIPHTMKYSGTQLNF